MAWGGIIKHQSLYFKYLPAYSVILCGAMKMVSHIVFWGCWYPVFTITAQVRFFLFFFNIYDVNRSKSRYKLGLLPWCQQIAQCLLVNWGCWDRKGSTSSSNGSIENLKSICLCLQNLVFYLSLLSIDEQVITFFESVNVSVSSFLTLSP